MLTMLSVQNLNGWQMVDGGWMAVWEVPYCLWPTGGILTTPPFAAPDAPLQLWTGVFEGVGDRDH